jgi:hypothetical protein
MNCENDNSLAVVSCIRDTILLMFALYAMICEFKGFTTMANLAICVPCAACACVEVANKKNSNTRRIAELVSFAISIVDILLIMIFGASMQPLVKSGIMNIIKSLISPTGAAVLLSAIGTFRAAIVLFSDYKKAELGIEFKQK